MVVIEQKASGTPLTHELRQMDIPVMPFTPSRGNDKHVRINSCAPLFEAGFNLGSRYAFCRRSG
jgi:phage terminase large subunit-like protein